MTDQVLGNSNSQGGTVPVESNARVMVKGTIGTIINEFNLKDNWSNWSEILSLHYIANDV